MVGIEEVIIKHRPGLVMVVGDVNSTMAGALAASKQNVPVAHVEAGLRSFDRTMPEEINRMVTDAISDHLFVSEPSGTENLRREGISADKIHYCGNVMIDTLLRFKPRASRLKHSVRFALNPGSYALLTLHRPGNVDDQATLGGIVDALEQIAGQLPVVLCAHPRTQARLKDCQLLSRFKALKQTRRRSPRESGLWMLPPQGYLEFFSLLLDSRLLLTDSGGLQEESSVLKIPCLTLRDNTERPVTIKLGTSTLVGNDPAQIVRAFKKTMRSPRKSRRIPLWDGKAGDRIAKVTARILGKL
jgi:UDP-N-acetylglucosamine 2-epimerase (non-hydrolysing)